MPKERKGDADVLRSLLSDAALKSEKYVCVARCQVRSRSARGRAPLPRRSACGLPAGPTLRPGPVATPRAWTCPRVGAQFSTERELGGAESGWLERGQRVEARRHGPAAAPHPRALSPYACTSRPLLCICTYNNRVDAVQPPAPHRTERHKRARVHDYPPPIASCKHSVARLWYRVLAHAPDSSVPVRMLPAEFDPTRA